MAERFADADGRPPQHTFFFPEEDYRPELLDALAELCAPGFGDVEVHLHHDRDTACCHERAPAAFHRDAVSQTRPASPQPLTGAIAFGFVHGNWALDNARPDGRWCGVNDEISVLVEAGCYADFTLPAAPDASQTRTMNSIYYAIDDPSRPRSHDYGIPARSAAAPAKRTADHPGTADLRLAPADLGHVSRARKRRARRYRRSSADAGSLRLRGSTLPSVSRASRNGCS